LNQGIGRVVAYAQPSNATDSDQKETHDQTRQVGLSLLQFPESNNYYHQSGNPGYQLPHSALTFADSIVTRQHPRAAEVTQTIFNLTEIISIFGTLPGRAL